MRILSIGSIGEDVIELQSDLMILGYRPGAVDGFFGAKTASAVIQFQKDNSLVSDGRVGPITWGKIKITYEIYIIQSGDTFYKIAIAKNIVGATCSQSRHKSKYSDGWSRSSSPY